MVRLFPGPPRRLLIIANSIDAGSRVGIGGAERTAVDLAMNVDRNVLVPSILTYENPGETGQVFKRNGIYVYHFPKKWKFDATVVSRLRTLLKEKYIDAVLSVNTGANLDNLLATSRLHEIACLIRVPSVRVKPRVALTEGRLAKRADALIVPGLASVETVSKQYSIDKTKIHVIPNGCDGQRFFQIPYTERAKYRRDLDLPANALILYTPSRVHRVKGQDVLAEALAGIPYRDLEIRNVLWVNTGRIQDNRLFNKIRSVTGDISRFVRLLDPATDPVPWYGAADWIVIPSREESFGISMLEAAFTGRPVLASRCGIAEEIETLHQGLTADPGNVASLRERLGAILTIDERERTDIGETLANYFRPKYSVETTAQAYEQAVLGAIDSRKR